MIYFVEADGSVTFATSTEALQRIITHLVEDVAFKVRVCEPTTTFSYIGGNSLQSYTDYQESFNVTIYTPGKKATLDIPVDCVTQLILNYRDANHPANFVIEPQEGNVIILYLRGGKITTLQEI